MKTGFKLALSAGVLVAMMGAANCADPSISLDKVTVKGGTISGNGTYDTGGKAFTSITLFAMPKAGGTVKPSTPITMAPGGGVWGPLDVSVSYQGVYQVWAVLVVSVGMTDYYYGSAVVDSPNVAVGTTPVPTSYITWAVGSPNSVGATINGSGSYTSYPGAMTETFQMWIWPAAGGPMAVIASTTNNKTSVWRASATGALGVSTNVSPLYVATTAGVPPITSGAPITPITP